ncbi:MAG: hypothetical protein C4567_16330 [Deltaproteobacteria bacterium]|nr:MAG: hypothetical protein C4567_16330 [Deltaproteobacteria bacterium]
MPRNGPNLVLFYLVLPWLLLVVILLNKSFLYNLFRRFTLAEAIKKNHALEHGTIYFLRRRFGKARIGGSAEADGFRICGDLTREHLVNAFNELLKELKKGHSELIISMQCGTNIATAQGLGVILLAVTTVILLTSGADRIISLLALIANVLLYFLLRARLGNWVQNKFFMSLDFSTAGIQSIYRVPKKIWWERNPVFFVKTLIS